MLFFALIFLIAKEADLGSFLFANSDTQLSVNSFRDFWRSLFSWSETLDSQGLLFPSLFAITLKVFFESIGFPLTSILSSVVLFGAIVYFSFKITKEILDFHETRFDWLILVISLFSISNEMMRTWLTSNLTIIWSVLFFLVSFFCFIKFKNNPANKSYIFFVFIALLLVPIDFHALLLSVLFIFSFLLVEYFAKKFLLKKRAYECLPRSILITVAAFLLLNSYWIFNNINLALSKSSAYLEYSENSANTDGVLDFVTAYLNRPSLNFIFSTTSDHVGKFYPAALIPFDIVASFFFVSLAIFSIYFIIKEQNEKRKIQLITLWILYVVFLTFSLGPNNPMGIFNIFWSYVPGFKLFRDYFKFNRLILPILIVLVSYSSIKIFDFLKTEKRKTFFFGLILTMILIKFVPYYFLFPKYKPFRIPDYYYQINEYISKKKIDSKVQVAPVISWMQTFEWSNQNYDMQDPLGYFISKPTFINSVTYDENYNDKLNKRLQKYLIINDKRFLSYENIRSVGFLVARSDLGAGFLEKKKTDVNFIGQDVILAGADNSSFLTDKTEIGKLSIYELNKDQFLPHFYTPQYSLVSGRPIESLPLILSDKDWQIRSAVFLAGQNTGKEGMLDKLKNNNRSSSELDSSSNNSTLDSRLRGNDNSCATEGGVMSPTLEFKKINPTKYRVRVHGASGVFPLVFSESFNDGWKAYLNQNVNLKMQNDNSKFQPEADPPRAETFDDQTSKYKILDGNTDDQASKDELQNYLSNGYITTLGDGKLKTIEHKKWVDGKEQFDYVEKYKIDFVSKNFQDTIQNDNLPNGNLFETWFRRPIENNANHLMANGYANSWVIDTNLICQSNSKLKNQISNIKMGDRGLSGDCVQNPDGSYDFEMVVEFWPQRLFYVGLAISLSTLLGCVIYLAYDHRKWKKKKSLDPKIA
jgi:hypothetical protein